MVINKGLKPTLAAMLLASLLSAPALPLQAAESAKPNTYSAQFRDTDINEFISTVSAVLKKPSWLTRRCAAKSTCAPTTK